jgi:hypothetical protein
MTVLSDTRRHAAKLYARHERDIGARPIVTRECRSRSAVLCVADCVAAPVLCSNSQRCSVAPFELKTSSVESQV